MSEDNAYVCSLDEASVERARTELNEDPALREQAVNRLRSWIIGQPHLSYRTDTNYLLQILRTRKFNEHEAQKMVERNLRSLQSQPQWFRGIDTHDARIQAVLNTGVFVPLPGRDDFGRAVVLSQRGALDPDSSEYDHVDDFIRAALAAHLRMCRDEMTQVNGIVHFYDFSAFSMQQMKGWGFSNFKNIIKCWAGNFPGRFKGLHVFGGGHVMNIILMLYVHGNSLEDVYNAIPKRMLPVEYLPKDYDGPNAGTLRELIVWTERRTVLCWTVHFGSSLMIHSNKIYWMRNFDKKSFIIRPEKCGSVTS